MAQRAHYWSCTKFADWLRGSDKPSSATSKGWREWDRASKDLHPFRYWLAEEGLDLIQNAIHWPFDQLYSVKYYINNRWVSKTHALTSNLKRGQWHEFEERMLHCLFDELVDFVEIEQAWHHIVWMPKEERKKYDPPFWATGWFRWRTWRCPEAGLDYLMWAATLTHDENCGLKEGDDGYGTLTQQANTAREILDLYKWWKFKYPNRKDIHDASGWSKLCDSRRQQYGDDLMWEDETEEHRKETRKVLDLTREIEEQYAKEEEEMLIRLIKIRHGLWT